MHDYEVHISSWGKALLGCLRFCYSFSVVHCLSHPCHFLQSFADPNINSFCSLCDVLPLACASYYSVQMTILKVICIKLFWLLNRFSKKCCSKGFHVQISYSDRYSLFLWMNSMTSSLSKYFTDKPRRRCSLANDELTSFGTQFSIIVILF